MRKQIQEKLLMMTIMNIFFTVNILVILFRLIILDSKFENQNGTELQNFLSFNMEISTPDLL